MNEFLFLGYAYRANTYCGSRIHIIGDYDEDTLEEATTRCNEVGECGCISHSPGSGFLYYLFEGTAQFGFSFDETWVGSYFNSFSCIYSYNNIYTRIASNCPIIETMVYEIMLHYFTHSISKLEYTYLFKYR